MIDHLDESQLLALVEGELDAQAAAAMCERLAGDPRAMAFIEGVRSDRAALRALAEPELPVDFLAQIEPMLTRPMLMEPVAEMNAAVALAASNVRPGEFRRQYRRQHRRINWRRLALVAMVLVSVIGGIWAVVNGLVGSGGTTGGGGTDGGLIADGGAGSGPADRGDGASNLPALTAADGTIHHNRPLPVDGELTRLALANGRAVPRTNQVMADPSPNAASLAMAPVQVRAADFAIVVQAADAAKIEASLARTMSAVSPQSALVRNFSFAEARQLALKWEREHVGTTPDQPLVASIDAGKGATAKLLAERVREVQRRGPTVSVEMTSGLVAGSKDLSPSLEQQLDYSGRGAILTVAVPASRLVEFIERLGVGENLATSLRMLPAMDWSTLRSDDKPAKAEGPADAAGVAGAGVSTMMWVTDGPRVRQAIELLRQSKDDLVVLVPVVIKAAR